MGRDGVGVHDQAATGSCADRAGYQEMLADAKARQFDVWLVDDMSRLSRVHVEAESTFRRLEHWGVCVISASDGYDSRAASRKVHRTVKNLMNEVYLDDLAERTHRGLEGQARAGNNAGGRAYGYRSVPVEDPSRPDAYGPGSPASLTASKFRLLGRHGIASCGVGMACGLPARSQAIRVEEPEY